MSTTDRVEDLPGSIRQDLADWLLTLADNKRVLGLRYGEWCVGAPELEADVTISAMAQYELGHARLLRGVLGDLPEDPRDGARRTEPSTWRSLPALDRPAPTWTELVVINALVDNLLTVNLQAAAQGGIKVLSQRLRKVVSEEHFHSLHAEAWFERLLSGPDTIVERLQRATDAVWPQCIAWFGPDGVDNSLDRLAAGGVLDAGAAELRSRFLAKTVPLFQGAVRIPVEQSDGAWKMIAEIDWDGWSEASRRHGSPDFDQASFAMITGAHARAMGVHD